MRCSPQATSEPGADGHPFPTRDSSSTDEKAAYGLVRNLPDPWYSETLGRALPRGTGARGLESRTMAEQADPFSGDRYRVRGRLSLQGRLFQVENEAAERVLFAEHPLFQTERELILYADEKLLLPLIAVVERGHSSLRRTLDVFDARTKARLGVLRGAVFSTLTGNCDVLGPDDGVAGRIVRAPRRGRNRLLDLFLSSFSTSVWVFELGGVAGRAHVPPAGSGRARARGGAEPRHSAHRPALRPRLRARDADAALPALRVFR